ncbi:bifunctional protein folC [Amniculicola lignicola CBS 123094]|uniref:Folylpolyglutamate synthase n=1 Tax=Amniculicola lignicola CBS 123094 TaxID=1392246 RepID=A0A6A5WHE9_9PLEO|nr:bifunctional protein folC [Amniculicola lignicola CBS 123094]
MITSRMRLGPRQMQQYVRSIHSPPSAQPWDYAAAITALNSIQTNFAIIDAIRKSGRGMNKQAIPEFIEWLRKAGYKPSDFERLRPIHISGTKGKGSTSAFVSSILNQYLPKAATDPRLPKKIGLYTSPHLRFVRERIQINDEFISEEQFTKYLFQVWDRLEAAEKASPSPPGVRTKPVYFRYLTLVGLNTFMNEGVDTAVIECGVGGEYDSTNILTRPTVSAITSLGIDHTGVLGKTLSEIAWHKGGIFKKGVPAFTSPQKEEALAVLRERAAEKGTTVEVVDIHPALANDEIKLALSAGYQKINASLAIVAAATHLRSIGYTDVQDPRETKNIDLPPEFVRGLQQCKWPGRCDIRREKNVAWFLDGGHTLESIEVTGRWFAEQISASKTSWAAGESKTPRILVFNQQTRDAIALSRALYDALQCGVTAGAEPPFTHVIFTTNKTFVSGGYSPDLISINANAEDVDSLVVQNALAETWSEIDPTANVQVFRTIEESLDAARGIARDWVAGIDDKDAEVMALVTGSLHLVGGAIDVLETGRSAGTP